MHIGGACSKPVVRSADPSAGGHGRLPGDAGAGAGQHHGLRAGRGVGGVARVGGARSSSASSALKMAMPPATTTIAADDQAQGAGLALALDLLGGRPLRLEAQQPALVLALSLLARHGGEQ